MYKITLRKVRATWHWFTTNPQGGGFGSSNVGSKASALNRAAQTLMPGQQYALTVNGKEVGVFTKA